jgi:putative transposase
MEMNTREIATAYRISQWTQALQERKESGESIKEFCQRKGVSRNTYFYWQRKLRETVCREIIPAQQAAGEQTMIPSGWAVCEAAAPEAAKTLIIEIGKSRISAGPDTDMELLGKVCRELMSLC